MLLCKCIAPHLVHVRMDRMGDSCMQHIVESAKTKLVWFYLGLFVCLFVFVEDIGQISKAVIQ